MIEKETFDQVVAYLEEQGYFLTGWGGTPLDKGRVHRVLQIRKARRLKRPKETWGTLWFEKNDNGWIIYCWLNKKADELIKLARRLEEKFHVKISFRPLHGHE